MMQQFAQKMMGSFNQHGKGRNFNNNYRHYSKGGPGGKFGGNRGGFNRGQGGNFGGNQPFAKGQFNPGMMGGRMGGRMGGMNGQMGMMNQAGMNMNPKMRAQMQAQMQGA